METKAYRSKYLIRVVTAASLFDGHDAAINIMSRILQDTGAEVIHIGHNRSVMDIDDFVPSLSFFFSNGMDPEYTVIGRVARRIWAIAMKYYYKAGEKSQKLKYHIQTSGCSLHSRGQHCRDFVLYMTIATVFIPMPLMRPLQLRLQNL